MRISKIALLSTGFVLLIAVSAFAFMVVSKKRNVEPKVGSITVSTQDGNIVNNTHLDVQMYDNLKDLYANADYVVRGTVTKKNTKTRNLARNWRNEKEEAQDRTTISQEYSFAVSSWIKGNGEKDIEIVYPDYTVYKSDNNGNMTL